MEEAVIMMLVDDSQLHKGALSDEVHEAKQERGKEEVLGVISEGGSEVPPEMEDVGEGPPSTPVVTKVGPLMGYVTFSFVATGSTSHHVIILVGSTSHHNHPFFEGLHSLSSGVGFVY